MLKRKIKIILIGLSSLLFMGLIYSLFSAKPEIIADESLRIEEPEIPGLQSQVERAVNVNDNIPSELSDSQIESSLESKLVDQPVANYRKEIVSLSEQKVQIDTPDQAPTELVETTDEVVGESKVLSSELPKTLTGSVENSQAKVIPNEWVSPFRDDAIKQSAATVDQKKNISSGASASDTSEFIDLNLTETDSEQEEKGLTKRDQLIVDDINKALGKYKSVGPDVSKGQIDKDQIDSAAVKTKTAVSDPNIVDGASSAVETAAKGDKEINPTKAPLTKLTTTKPSVFTIPEIDQDMMQGDSSMSEEYRQTMAKLISINTKLTAADNENAELQARFEMTVNQNRQLAQIIRDIDTQIKAFTLTN